jgi:hypothetical protein
MTVYVDDSLISARVGRISGRWSHLFADTRVELHEFADRLGLKRSWFQDPAAGTTKGTRGRPAKPGSYHAESWHYDVTEGMRAKAIALGAVSVSWRDTPNIIRNRMGRKTT